MPYADPEQKAEWMREYKAVQYQTSEEFRRQEAKRKAAWFAANKKRAAESKKRWRIKTRAKELIDAGEIDKARKLLERLEQ